MPYDDRKAIIEEIENLRGGRRLISLCNFDRVSKPPLPGVSTQFHAELKESLFRVLKESEINGNGIDIFLYTRGGDLNSVWPIISLLREYDPNFETLISFRSHSAGTLLALGAKKIVMTKIGELSPIDPSTGNQFNPIDPVTKTNRLGISVEDVNAYEEYIKKTLSLYHKEKLSIEELKTVSSFIEKLCTEIHPLALGNVYRVNKLIQGLSEKILCINCKDKKKVKEIIESLTVKPYSHLHMFNRKEAQEILGEECVEYASQELDAALDKLLRQYEDDFALRNPLFTDRLFQTPHDNNIEFRFIGGAVESKKWGYLFETTGKISQFSQTPPNINIQIPPGQAMPFIPGLPKRFEFEIYEQKWSRNTEPKGVTK